MQIAAEPIVRDLVFVFDDARLLQKFRQISPGQQAVLSRDYRPASSAGIFVVTEANHPRAESMYNRMSRDKKKHSLLITYRPITNAKLQPGRLIEFEIAARKHRLVPDIYCYWLCCVAGLPHIRVFPQYFFETNDRPELHEKLQVINQAFLQFKAGPVTPPPDPIYETHLIPSWKGMPLITKKGIPPKTKPVNYNTNWLEEQTGLFGSQLWHCTTDLYGVAPGTLMRVCRLFLITAECQRREWDIRLRHGRRISLRPDAHCNGDYRRSLQRCFGVEYGWLKVLQNPYVWEEEMVRGYTRQEAEMLKKKDSTRKEQ